jgi:hypothetical protein
MACDATNLSTNAAMRYERSIPHLLSALFVIVLLACQSQPSDAQKDDNPSANPDPGTGRSLATDSVQERYSDTVVDVGD